MIMENGFSFQVFVDHNTERQILADEVALNAMLSKHGVRISYAPSRNQGKKGLVRYSVIIRMEPDLLKRGAGRKAKDCRITMDEALRKEEEGMAKADIAALMGVSLSTYYRKRKLCAVSGRG